MDVIVMGCGSYYELKKDTISQSVNIIALADNNEKLWGEKKNGISIISPENISNYSFNKIIIMTGKKWFEVSRQLIKLGIQTDKIEMGMNYLPFNYYESGFLDGKNKKILVNNVGNLEYHCNGITIEMSSVDEMNNVQEIFAKEAYNYNIGSSQEEEIVIDVGMNIAAAALYFANKSSVHRVFAYEPFHMTYRLAEKNIKLNKKLKSKITSVNCGLFNQNMQKKVEYNNQMTCGMSIIDEWNHKAIDNYESWELMNRENSYLDTITLRDISEVLLDVIKQYPNKKRIMKIDCEGSEFEIFDKLDEKKLFYALDVLIVEWHYRDKHILENILMKNNYYYIVTKESENIGMIYAFKK